METPRTDTRPTGRPRGGRPRGPARATGELTEREIEIARLLAEGDSTEDISKVVHLADRTVKLYIYEMMRKLGVRNRAHIVGECYRRRILHLDPPKPPTPEAVVRAVAVHLGVPVTIGVRP